jgi:hypothetical protein
MKRILAISAALAFVAPALASDTAEHCRAYAAANGTDASGCDCLGAAAAKDATLKEALAAIKTPADLEAASDATKAAIRACYPSSENPAIQG